MRVALRNAVGVVAPLAVGLLLGHANAGLAIATGALNTMFTDQPGPYRLRMQRMLLAAMPQAYRRCSASPSARIRCCSSPPCVLVAFAGGMLVALGPMAARVGLTSMIVMMVTADMRLAPSNAPGVAALIFAGGVLQMLLAVAAWPLQRYRPERFALAGVLRQLAATAHARPDASQPPPVSQAALDALVMLHGEHRARGVAMQSFRVLAEICERVRMDCSRSATCIPASATMRSAHGSRLALERASTVLERLADAVRDGEPRTGQAVTSTRCKPNQVAGNALEPPAERRDARLLRIAVVRAESLGRADAFARAQRRDRQQPGRSAGRSSAEARLPAAIRPGAPLPTLRANLNRSSVAFRHALRCALCVAFAAGCERALQLPHGVWIPMTAAVVIKPDFGGTLRFGVLRVAGPSPACC